MGPVIPPSCDGMLDFIGSFMPDGIPLFITGAFDIMSVDELELGVMSGTPGCNIPEPVGGVTETGGVFIVELPCAPGAGMVFCML